jgi:hypothetical protein
MQIERDAGGSIIAHWKRWLKVKPSSDLPIQDEIIAEA